MASSNSLAKRFEEAKKKIESRPQWLKERPDSRTTDGRALPPKPRAEGKR